MPTNATVTFYNQPESVCVLRLSAIGDCCHVLPVIRTLQAAWPQARFTWIIGKTEASLFGDIPDIDFVVVDKSAGLRGHREARSQLRGKRFDLLLHMHPSLRANLLSLSVKAPERLGFDRARAKDTQWLFTNRRILERDRQHVMDSFFGFAEAVGVNDRVLRWDIPLSEADRTFASEVVGDAQRVITISPCSSAKRGRQQNFRNWNPERYAAVADHAVEKHSARVVLTGDTSSSTRAFAHEIVRGARNEMIDLVGQTSLKQLLALIERSTVLLCPDSGPAHMATAAGTPVVGLYGSTNPERAGPYLSLDHIVNKYPEAVMKEYGKPVDALPWGARVHSPAALELIEVEDVVRKLDAVLESTDTL